MKILDYFVIGHKTKVPAGQHYVHVSPKELVTQVTVAVLTGAIVSNVIKLHLHCELVDIWTNEFH